MEEIPTLKELTDMYDRGELKDHPESAWYEVYPTELHKERNSIGFIPLTEVKNRSEMIKEQQDRYNKEVIWKKI